MRLGMDGQCWEHSTYGNKEFRSTRISFAFGSRSTAVGDGEYVSTLNMPELRDRLQGVDCNDKGPPGLAKLCDRIGEDRNVTDMLPGLQHHSCSTGAQSDFRFLARTTKSFHRKLFFIGCSIPVWLPRPPQV
ncbi:hypothetical protein F2Q70_00027460 [Brassica cretica]|uniref:Uncharacterized protein n=1 Tax=Brassica cretica TaxID=69181 RepID=A0A8S9L7K3_BRACR|nr:hypothetical protein F2Q68_00027032 [Brassica cretica]KAF2604180.1 hypothetical protein F2Q70_00027460 [Brassica cretica]